MANILLLGTGLVGSAIAADLCRPHKVCCLDCKSQRLQKIQQLCSGQNRLDMVSADICKDDWFQYLSRQDLVINALPGKIGFQALSSAIKAGKPVVDIAFYAEDPLSLSELAEEKNIAAVVDMGVAPGMSNLLLGYENAHMQIDSFTCYVGGLPKVRTLPFQYKAPFSPSDVIEEYTRTARLRRHGNEISLPALSEREQLDFPETGTLEAFNTDGLRTLLKTMAHIPNMAEKTLRYPGHVDLIEALSRAGFFDRDNMITPGLSALDATTHILRQSWKLDSSDLEFTLMHMQMTGTKEHQPHSVCYHLYDETDRENGISSMARTTGYAATAVANLILEGKLRRTGIITPEALGAEFCQAVLDYQKQRGIEYQRSESACP